MNKTITPYTHFQPYINPEDMEEVRYIDPSFPVELWSANFENLAHNRLSTHWHEAFEFALIISGKALYRSGAEWVTLSAGDALFVNSTVSHSTAPFAQELELFTIAFPPTFFGLPGYKLYEETVTPVLHSKNGASVLADPHIICTLREIYADSQKTELSILRLAKQIFQLWDQFIDYIGRPDTAPYAIHKPDSREELHLKQCVAFIRQNWKNTFTIEDIASSASISKNTCYRLFKKYLHVTPSAYINHFRISHAELMLLETDLPVSEIAYNCGFNSVVYFDRVFRQFHNKTPLEYRHTER